MLFSFNLSNKPFLKLIRSTPCRFLKWENIIIKVIIEEKKLKFFFKIRCLLLLQWYFGCRKLWSDSWIAVSVTGRHPSKLPYRGTEWAYSLVATGIYSWEGLWPAGQSCMASPLPLAKRCITPGSACTDELWSCNRLVNLSLRDELSKMQEASALIFQHML